MLRVNSHKYSEIFTVCRGLRDVNAGQPPRSDTYRRPKSRATRHGVGTYTMAETTTDYYELLQISPNAEPETIHRVYRLLAQRFHPDNKETGDARRFRTIHDA